MPIRNCPETDTRIRTVLQQTELQSAAFPYTPGKAGRARGCLFQKFDQLCIRLMILTDRNIENIIRIQLSQQASQLFFQRYVQHISSFPIRFFRPDQYLVSKSQPLSSIWPDIPHHHEPLQTEQLPPCAKAHLHYGRYCYPEFLPV